MIRNNFLIVICVSVGLLQGCSNSNRVESALVKKDVSQREQVAQIAALEQCMHVVDTLVKLDKKYKKDSDEFYGLINEAKFYASVSGQTSASVTSTITPLFEYKINDKCNSISQKLLKEFEGRAKKADTNAGVN